jgi:putative membrane protein
MSFDPSTIRRPDPSLLIYYFIVALPTLFAFPFVFVPLLVKYITLQYKIDEEGVSMAWGFLFRREILLTYRRIQDIHVRRNIVHRWLGLSAVAIQTASGTSGAEMTIEGVREFEPLRDYLYTKMRGARGEPQPAAPEATGAGDEALALLREIRDELRGVR